MAKRNGKDHRNRISIQLLELEPDITAADRQECSRKLRISKVTISYYLKGEVRNNDLGIKMIEFFKTCISKREDKINHLCQTK